MKVRYANGSRDTVHLLGVDTPEVNGDNAPSEFEGVPDTGAGAACLADAGENASAYANARLAARRRRLLQLRAPRNRTRPTVRKYLYRT